VTHRPRRLPPTALGVRPIWVQLNPSPDLSDPTPAARPQAAVQAESPRFAMPSSREPHADDFHHRVVQRVNRPRATEEKAPEIPGLFCIWSPATDPPRPGDFCQYFYQCGEVCDASQDRRPGPHP
jgi:hypothetical protein